MKNPQRRAVGAARDHFGCGRQVVLVELAAVGDEVDDHPVGQPLDRRVVVGEHVAVRYHRLELGLEERHERGDGRRRFAAARSTSASRSVGSSNREQELVEAQRRPAPRLRELGQTVVPIASGSRSSPGTRATFSAMTPPGSRCSRTSWKNSRVAR